MLFLAMCIWLLFSNVLKRNIWGRREYTGLRKTVVCSLMLMVSIYLIIWFVNKNIYIIDAEEEIHRLSNHEIAFNSLFEMLQTFTLDAPYEQLVSKLQDIITAMGHPRWKCVCIGIYSYIAFACAPIAGGFVLFEVIASIFPRLLVLLSLVRFYKNIMYFSELNERSIAFAKNVVENSSWWKRPILIFTDAYSDDRKEKNTELILAAKSMGAICINDDILHIHLRKTHFKKLGKKQIFLIDNNEENNLQTLAQMAEIKYSRFLKWTEIFLFAENDVSPFLEKVIETKLRAGIENIYSKQIERKKKREISATVTKLNKEKNDISDYIPKLERIEKYISNVALKDCRKDEKDIIESKLKSLIEEKKKAITWNQEDLQKELLVEVNKFVNDDLMPDIKHISAKRNIIINLLKDKPLFEPLVANGIKPPAHKGEKFPLTVTIVGAGQLGTEAFLTTYWCGQLLNCNLTINVISKEKETEFKEKVDFINPQILKTSEKDVSLLKIYDDQNKGIAEPYFTFNYFETNIRGIEKNNIDSQAQAETEENAESIKSVLEASDYIVVTLGTDEKNIIFADRIKRIIKISNLSNNMNRKTLIAYVVYNSEICDALNKKSLDETGNIYMHAFASMSEIYSLKNIYMESSKDTSEEIRSSYDARIKDIMAENKEKVKQNKKTSYDYWADIARANHIEYKVFSAGKISKSVFDIDTNEDQLVESRNADLQEYKEMLRWDCKKNNLTLNELIEQYHMQDFDFDDLKEDEVKKLVEILLFSENNKLNEERMKEIESIYHELAWLEHRRWNAFMRVNGFVAPENFDALLNKNKSQKDLSLKLHSCIVECSKNGKTDHLLDRDNTNGLDLLDKVSVEIKKSGINSPNDVDYKIYDYPEYDFKCNDNGEIEE